MVKAGLKAIYLSRLAGRGRREPRRRRRYPDQSLYPANIGAGARAAPQQRAAARRPDRARPRATAEPRLARADRRRRRGRLRRAAQRLRADEGDDRGRRRGRALRGPARVREEVRPPRRQGARADARSSSARSRRRGWPPTCCDVPTVLVARTDALGAKLLTSDVDERDDQFLTGERTPEGFFRVERRHRGRDRARPRVRAVRRPVWCETSTPDLGEAREFAAGDPRASSRASCSPTTARRRSTGSAHLDDDDDRELPARARRRWATGSSSSRSPASTR